jgi:hypothetical protein
LSYEAPELGSRQSLRRSTALPRDDRVSTAQDYSSRCSADTRLSQSPCGGRRPIRQSQQAARCSGVETRQTRTVPAMLAVGGNSSNASRPDAAITPRRFLWTHPLSTPSATGSTSAAIGFFRRRFAGRFWLQRASASAGVIAQSAEYRWHVWPVVRECAHQRRLSMRGSSCRLTDTSEP